MTGWTGEYHYIYSLYLIINNKTKYNIYVINFVLCPLI